MAFSVRKNRVFPAGIQLKTAGTGDNILQKLRRIMRKRIKKRPGTGRLEERD